jgi:thiol-disulfide isomerase/thioredoxin
MKRREYLRTGAAGVAAATLAGCLGGGRRGGAGGGTATGTPGENELATLEVAGSPGDVVAVLPAGEPALLDFWATWCAPCKPQMAELRAVRERFGDLHMLSITNEGDEAAIRDFWTEYEGTWAVAADPELRTNQRFDVTRIPTLLVFDGTGAVTWRHVGLAAADTIVRELEATGVEG